MDVKKAQKKAIKIKSVVEMPGTAVRKLLRKNCFARTVSEGLRKNLKDEVGTTTTINVNVSLTIHCALNWERGYHAHTTAEVSS